MTYDALSTTLGNVDFMTKMLLLKEEHSSYWRGMGNSEQQSNSSVAWQPVVLGDTKVQKEDTGEVELQPNLEGWTGGVGGKKYEEGVDAH
jgi:hypothetical protein